MGNEWKSRGGSQSPLLVVVAMSTRDGPCGYSIFRAGDKTTLLYLGCFAIMV